MSHEVICSHLNIRNKIWIIFNIYRPPYDSSLKDFFKKLEISLNKSSECIKFGSDDGRY